MAETNNMVSRWIPQLGDWDQSSAFFAYQSLEQEVFRVSRPGADDEKEALAQELAAALSSDLPARARQQVLARIQAQKREHHVLKRSPEKSHPYIISALDEKSLVARKKLKAYASISIALLLLSLIVFMSAVRAPLPV